MRVADLGAIVTALQEDFVLLNAATNESGDIDLAPVDQRLLDHAHSGRPAAALLNEANYGSLRSTCLQAAEARMPVGFVAEYLAAGRPRVLDATCLPIFEDDDATRCRYFLCTARDVASDFYRMVVSNDGLPGIAGELAMALNREEFEIRYEPIFEVRSGRMCGSLARLLWNHPERGLLEASEFVPAAEQTRQINDIGEWFLSQACEDAAGWNHQADGRRTTVDLSISAVQVRSGAALRSITAALSRSGLDPTLLIVSLNASALIGDRGDLPALMAHLAALGVQVNIVNAGLGFQAVAAINDISGGGMRVHRDLLRGVSSDDRAREQLTRLVEAFRPLGMALGVEGVTSSGEVELLKHLGFEHITGPCCGEALPAAEFADYVAHAAEIPLH